MTVLNEETHQTDTRTSSWDGGEIATGSNSTTPMSISPAPVSPSVAPQPPPAQQFQPSPQNQTE
jgi:hypothetical protein